VVELLCKIKKGASWRIAQSEPGVSIHACHGVQALHDQIGTLENRDMHMTEVRSHDA
jgi:hypothetical protein